MSTAWDAIVVGARVASASTVLLLARAGLRVLCVDRARYGSDTVSTHGLMRAGTPQLQRWGLLDAIIAAGTPAVLHTVFRDGHDEVSVSIRPAAGVDALYAPRRTLLDTVIVDAAVEAGAVVRFGTAVTGLLRDCKGASPGWPRGLPTAPPDGTRRVVIGANGRHSLVAERSAHRSGAAPPASRW